MKKLFLLLTVDFIFSRTVQVNFNTFHFYIFILVLLAVSFVLSSTSAWSLMQLAGELLCSASWPRSTHLLFCFFFFSSLTHLLFFSLESGPPVSAVRRVPARRADVASGCSGKAAALLFPCQTMRLVLCFSCFCFFFLQGPKLLPVTSRALGKPPFARSFLVLCWEKAKVWSHVS